MTEKEIFEHLFSIGPRSKDTDGVVTACLVREGEIIADAVSAGIKHAEYELIKKLETENITILPSDILYVTVQPCDRRSSPEGKAIGDCTTNTTKAGVKQIVYAADYHKSLNSIERFAEAGVKIRQCDDVEIVKKAVELFNSTNDDPAEHIPLLV